MAIRFCRTWISLHVLLIFSSSFSTPPSLATAADTISPGQSLSGNQTIVSKGGLFELGFFRPGKSLNHYIGIWYKKSPANSPHTVIWVANRDKPISSSSSSELKIAGDGNLVLLNQSKAQIWSSNLTTSRRRTNSTVAILLDTGNLVMREQNTSSSSSILWQSFDQPTDTWLPGGRVGWNKLTGEYMTLNSWRSPDDPSHGLYSFGMDPSGTDQLVMIWNGSETYWTSGEWNGRFFSSVPELTRNQVYNYTYIASEKYMTYSLFDTGIITRFVVNVSGQGIQWAWLNNSADWMLVWYQPRLQCDIYSLCGVNSICEEKGTPLCRCLEGFKPASPSDWDAEYWTGGCMRRTPLQCGKNGSGDGDRDRFLVLPKLQLPKVPLFMSELGSVEECQLACLSNCSCSGFIYGGDGGGESNGCYAYGDLRNIRSLTGDIGVTGDFYLRIAASEVPKSKSNKGIIVGVVIGLIGLLIVVLSITILLWRCLRRGSIGVGKKAMVEGPLVLFRYRDLQSLTNNFSERLGRGGFGSVYKGILPDSTAIAVKKLEGLRQGEKEFRAEVTTMGTIQHINLVRLIGFCCQGDNRILVYEYMSNGSLHSHLWGGNSGGGDCAAAAALDWNARYRIALGTARGLAYLHEECRDCIIHCDVKPENVLLDSEFCPKVSDFGMAKLMGREFSRVLTSMKGTFGYLAPEWLSGLPITPKADVYSYGMMLFELVSGRRNNEHFEGEKSVYFPVWAAKRVAEGDVLGLLDERLEGNADVGQLVRVCRVACWCIQDRESHRPPMGLVVQMLEGILEVGMPPVPRSLELLTEDQNHSVYTSASSTSDLPRSSSTTS